jgi:hypothetical protein
MVGVLDVVGSTNIAMKKGFEQNGYYVEEYNYRTELTNRGPNGMHEHFDGFISDRKFDLIVFCKTNQMNPVFLDIAKRCGPTWYWFMDPMSTARQMNAAGYAANATFASATASDVADRFQMINKNGHHMFEGYDPDVYFYEDIKKIRDFIFIGNATIPRIMAINELTKAGLEVTIFGYGWPIGMNTNSPVFGEDERIEINQSRAVLNLCQDDVLFSDRIIKSLGCGAFVFSQPCKDLLNSEIGSNLFFFNNANDLNKSREVSYINPELVMEWARTTHSWRAVCAGIMEKVREYNERPVR